jgi:hypothetical protein
MCIEILSVACFVSVECTWKGYGLQKSRKRIVAVITSGPRHNNGGGVVGLLGVLQLS